MARQLDLRSIIIEKLGECIEECVNDILYNVDFSDCGNSKAKVKGKIFPYLKEKYNVKGSPTKGRKDYWLMRGFSREKADEFKKYYSQKYYNSNSIDKICEKHNTSREEAYEIKNDRIQRMKNSFENKTDEEKQLINQKKAHTLDNFIEKYGPVEGKRKYETLRKEKQKRNTLEGFVERYGEQEGRKKYDEFLRRTKEMNTLENYIKEYGEEQGKEIYKEICNKKAKSKTLNGYIERYGEEKGKHLFNLRQERWQKSLNNKSEEEKLRIKEKQCVSIGRASTESLKVFIPLYKFLRKNGIKKEDIYFGIGGSKEFFISEKNNIFYLYDFTIRSKNIIIEFHGIGFHPKTRTDPDWQQCLTKEGPEKIYDNDRFKRRIAENNGFHVIEIWSDSTPEENLNYLKEKLYEIL